MSNLVIQWIAPLAKVTISDRIAVLLGLAIDFRSRINEVVKEHCRCGAHMHPLLAIYRDVPGYAQVESVRFKCPSCNADVGHKFFPPLRLEKP